MREALAHRAARPRVLGKDDCVPFVADHVLRRTGVDLIAEWRGKYSTEAERDALLNEEGGLARAVIRRMRGSTGWRRIDPGHALDPAIGLLQVGDDCFCGLSIGYGHWMVRAMDRAFYLPDDYCRRAWQWG